MEKRQTEVIRTSVCILRMSALGSEGNPPPAQVEVGGSVQVKITGRWADGPAFEAYDSIRVINPEK